MKRIITIGLLTILSLFLGLGVCTSALAGPEGDLVVAMENIGNEVWAPDVGSSYDQGIIAPVFDNLVYVCGDDKPQAYIPQLAERWETSDDGLTWDFYLHKGIQFHDGWGELTAEDVKFTYELAGKPGSTRDIPIQTGPDKAIQGFEVVDSYHFRIKLNKVLPLLLSYLSESQANIVCKKYFEKVGHDKAMKHPIGSGPWKFVDYKPANYIKFEAVENHWRQPPAFKTLTLRAVPELSARLAMLQSGEADITNIPPDRKAELEALGLHTRLVAGASAYTVALGGSHLASRPHYDPTCPWVYNSDQPWDSPFNKKAYMVRKALAYAINKDAIISKILNNLADPTPLRAWPIGNTWARESWKPYPYDPKKAKELLIQAGYPNGFSKPITMYAISGAGSALHPKVSEAVAMDWQSVLGLDVKIVPADWPVVRAKTVDRNTAWCAYVTGWIVFLEPWLDASYSGHSKGNFVEGFEHEEMDALIDTIKSTSDYEKRRQAALKLGDFEYEHITEIGIATGYAVIACSPKVGKWNIRYSPSHIPYDMEYISHAK